MKFCTSHMFCKFVINTIHNNVVKIRKLKIFDDYVENALYESYVKLEKILNDEFL